MPVYTDQTQAPTLLPDGDYKFEVVDFECGMSKSGGKTAGSDMYIVTVQIEEKGNQIDERLIDHESTRWKLDCFLKCTGITIAKGESYEFREDIAESTGVRWVDPFGLRGWCRIITEEYVKKDGTKGKANRIAVFYTDKEKLPQNKRVDPIDENGF